MIRFVCLALLSLSACMPLENGQDTATRAVVGNAGAAANSFVPQTPMFAHTAKNQLHSNADLARDFLDLSFELESGRRLARFTRFEGPITVRLTGNAAATTRNDLNRLIVRLQNEANIPILSVVNGPANITVQSLPKHQINWLVPKAACFVAPNVSSAAEYRTYMNTPVVDWATLETRAKLTVFVPSDSSPQAVRDCLHEELAQALGPVNDLYRLTDSVFNDDNVHAVLTNYDMMILRAYYDPSLKSGMTRQQVAAKLPAIFGRINPRGQGLARSYVQDAPADWRNAIRIASANGGNQAARLTAAYNAIHIAKSQGWNDTRRAYSHYTLGRLLLNSDTNAAYEAFVTADRFYALGGNRTQLHRAFTASQLAMFHLASGDTTTARQMINPHLKTAMAHQNTALYAMLQFINARSWELEGDTAMARTLRNNSMQWANYGFGNDFTVGRYLSEIAAFRRH